MQHADVRVRFLFITGINVVDLVVTGCDRLTVGSRFVSWVDDLGPALRRTSLTATCVARGKEVRGVRTGDGSCVKL